MPASSSRPSPKTALNIAQAFRSPAIRLRTCQTFWERDSPLWRSDGRYTERLPEWFSPSHGSPEHGTEQPGGRERPAVPCSLMTAIVTSIEIDRPADVAFAYVINPATMPEWQQGVVRGRLDTAETRVGSHCTTTRKIGGRESDVTTEITEYDPPRRWADRGIEGPIRAMVKVLVEPVANGSRSRVTIDLDFTEHGIGKVLVPLVVRSQAAREMPGNMTRLRERIEATA